jgi:uncharacterized membrane protein YphA (DoxX/SURF4 family)
VLLLAGVLTRAAAIAGGVAMIVLVLGATSIEHFSSAATGQPAHNRQPAQGAPATALWRFR